MNIILITQGDPFYLGKNINYLLNKLPVNVNVLACVVFEVSPFGKKESFLKKLRKTLKVFGPSFTFYYGLRFVYSSLKSKYKVKNVLRRHNVPIIHLPKSINNEESLKLLKLYNPDILVSIAGNQIFKKPLLELAPKGCINLHTALLPKYRGLMPSFWVLKNNEEYTGVSVFFVDEGIDSGPIIVQKKIKIENMTQSELISHSKKIGMDAIIEAIEKIHKNEVVLMDNDDQKMTYYSFPKREDVEEFRKIGKKFF